MVQNDCSFELIQLRFRDNFFTFSRAILKTTERNEKRKKRLSSQAAGIKTTFLGGKLKYKGRRVSGPTQNTVLSSRDTTTDITNNDLKFVFIMIIAVAQMRESKKWARGQEIKEKGQVGRGLGWKRLRVDEAKVGRGLGRRVCGWRECSRVSSSNLLESTRVVMLHSGGCTTTTYLNLLMESGSYSTKKVRKKSGVFYEQKIRWLFILLRLDKLPTLLLHSQLQNIFGVATLSACGLAPHFSANTR